MGTTLGAAPSAAQVVAGAAVTDIHAEQSAVVTAAHQGELQQAGLAVGSSQAAIYADQNALSADTTAGQAAAATAAEAAARARSDQAQLARARQELSQADQAVAADRDRLRVIAIGMYDGSLTNPRPTSVSQLEEEQEAVIDAAEAGAVAQVVDDHLGDDTKTAKADRAAAGHLTDVVQGDAVTEADAAHQAALAATRVVSDRSSLQADQGALARAQADQAAVQAQLEVALSSLDGPVSVPASALSILGGSALDADQLIAWFDWEGYVDLTATPIQQLATWYVQLGQQEGVRGDVAFAQAVLETGGFASPDAVNQSNFAGIGHCDSCSQGWAFPSPQAGVLGHLQMLRIWSSGSEPASPPPALAQITPANQHEAGCCTTVESLTGVWATDPTYGSQILSIYQSMLGWALGRH